MTPDELHVRLTRLTDASTINHHPMCGAHPVMDDGPCTCPNGVLGRLIGSLIDIHRPHESQSIDTLSCDEHNVTKPGRIVTFSTDDCESCPNCTVTPITVCSAGSCESYPCETIRAVADALQLGPVDAVTE
jgi:hypothetical protein